MTYVTSSGKAANGATNFTFAGRIEDNNGNAITNGIGGVTTNESGLGGDDIESVVPIYMSI